MRKKTELVRIQDAIGRELTVDEFWNVGTRILDALCKGGKNAVDNEVEAIIRELKAS